MSDWRVQITTWTDCDSEELARITYQMTEAAKLENSEIRLLKLQNTLGQIVPPGKWITVKSTEPA